MNTINPRVRGFAGLLFFVFVFGMLPSTSALAQAIKDKPVAKGDKAAQESFNKPVALDKERDKEIIDNFTKAASRLTELAKAIKDKKIKAPAGLDPDVLEKCETCLKKMLEQNKVMKETGTANDTRAATTWATFGAGVKRIECDPKTSTMNVNPNEFFNSKINGPAGGLEQLAAILAHEWCHTTQGEEPKGKAAREKECYTEESNVLEAFISLLGGENQAPTLKDRRDLVKKLADNPPSDPFPFRTPVGGFDTTLSGDGLSEYYVFFSAPNLLGRTSVTPGISTFALNMAHPLSILRLPGLTTVGGNEIVLISGIDVGSPPITPDDTRGNPSPGALLETGLALDTTGVIEAVQVSGGAAVSPIFTTRIPDSHPLSLAYDSVLNRVYVLDTLRDLVFILVPGALGVPQTPLPQPYATASRFPQVASAFNVAINALMPGSVILSNQNARGIDHINLDELLTALFDTDSDGIADDAFSFRKREAIELPPTFPEAPTDLTATPGNARVELSWGASPGALTYNVERATHSGEPYAIIATDLTTLKFTDTLVTNGATYFYVVTADNTAGRSLNSNEASATPQAAPASVPAAPANLMARPDFGFVALNWQASPGAAWYNIKRSIGPAGPFRIVAAHVPGANFVDTSVRKGTNYCYIVTAANAVGESLPSSSACATP